MNLEEFFGPIGSELSLPIEPYEVNRYCFKCKTVTKFIVCGNCCKMFCSKHAESATEYDGMGWKLYDYLIHKACL